MTPFAVKTKGVRRLWVAARYSWQGLRAAWQQEPAVRQELLLFLLAMPAAWWLGETALTRVALLGVVLLVLVVELINSAIEAIADALHPDAHPLIGRAKDFGSAAVFLALVLTALVWGAALWQRWTG